jgi:hypothetical protein
MPVENDYTTGYAAGLTQEYSLGGLKRMIVQSMIKVTYFVKGAG